MALEIPVIDLSNPDKQCADALVSAAASSGFIFVKLQGSDIPAAEVDKMFGLSKKFFASPNEEKKTVTIADNNQGWSAVYVETLDPATQKRGDFKEAMNFGEFFSGKAQQPLPPSLAGDEQDLSGFSVYCRKLCRKIMSLFAVGMEVDSGPDFFSPHHPEVATEGAQSGSILRLLYYPPLGSEYKKEIDIRAGAHSDYGSITLLFQRPGQSGLQILTPTGDWADVPAGKDGDILVNIGDLLEYWTAGVLKSTVHRVIFPEGATSERYSMAYFCHPVDKTALDPVPSKMVRERIASKAGVQQQGGADGDKAMTAKQHLHKRLADTYGWGKEEDKAAAVAA